MRVRTATNEEIPAALNVLDGAALETAFALLSDSVAQGQTLVAVSDDGSVLGALVLDGDTIESIAVRHRRRGQGIGTALVDAAAAYQSPLVAEFDADVRPFYETLGFAVEPPDDAGRYRGVREQ